MTTPSTDPSVSLEDCDREPIHVPGSIQPHGALLVVDAQGQLAMRSANTAVLLAGLFLPALGEPLTSAHLDGLLARREIAALDRGGATGVGAEVTAGATCFDAFVHRVDGDLVVELEPRPPNAPAPAALAARIHHICRTLEAIETTAELLQGATDAIREVTRFDRVMAYRFRPDGAGEVVAESRRPDLEPFLGLRYPASDIPAQARRLYTLNPLRIIPDVAYAPVELEPEDRVPHTGKPLDMSHAMLRSVSPIHVEYLTNMGVRASMSISVIQDGRLWGLIACHHMQPLRPAYAVRMGCLTLSSMLSLLVSRTTERETDALWRRSSDARDAIVARATAAEDLLQGVIDGSPSLRDVVACTGAAVALRGRLVTVGAAPPREAIRALVAWLGDQRADGVFVTDRMGTLEPAFADQPGLAGVLAAEFHPECDGFVLWFREEQVRAVRWAGNPEKSYETGPNGARLTPRGSFEEWRQLSSGASEPWLPGEVEAANSLREQLQEVALRASAQVEEMQSMLIGMLGHDLRNPLNAIASSAAILRGDDGDLALGDRIRRSTTRMSALISSMLDYAAIRRGGSLQVKRAREDVLAIAQGIAEESMAAFPGMDVQVEGQGPLSAFVDRARLEQVLSNLLSNARHHGDVSRPVVVRVREALDGVRLEVSNEGAPVPPEDRTRIFDPFHTRGPRGGSARVGLGLFICREIAAAHGGSIRVECGPARTTFVVQLPRHEAGALPLKP